MPSTWAKFTKEAPMSFRFIGYGGGFKGLIQLVFLFMVSFLVACNSGTSVTPQNTPPVADSNTNAASVVTPKVTTSPEMKATRPWKIAVAVKDQLKPDGKIADPNWETVWLAAQQAAKDFGVEVSLIPAPCQTCTDAQIKAVSTLVEPGKVDGLIIGAVDSVALGPVVEKVAASGVPVVAIDTPLSSDRLLTFVSFDNTAGGKAVGAWVAKQLQNKGQVAILNGPLEQQNARDRRNGFLEGLKQGSIEVVATADAKWDTETAQKITKEWLQRYPQLNAIVAANDRMALGASLAAGNKKVLITGFDALDVALEAIRKGQLGATVSQGFDRQSRLAVQLLIRHLEKKETFPAIVFLSEVTLITKDNVNSFR